MDPREWLARLADHIRDTDKHRTHFYGHYANRVRGQRSPAEVNGPTDEDNGRGDGAQRVRDLPAYLVVQSLTYHPFRNG